MNFNRRTNYTAKLEISDLIWFCSKGKEAKASHEPDTSTKGNLKISKLLKQFIILTSDIQKINEVRYVVDPEETPEGEAITVSVRATTMILLTWNLCTPCKVSSPYALINSPVNLKISLKVVWRRAVVVYKNISSFICICIYGFIY